MRKCVPLVVLSCIAVVVLTVTPRAQTSIAWQTTFACPDWNQSNGISDADVCNPGDGISGWGNWTTASGKMDQITAAANNPSGAGSGFRHWRGGANTTDNILGKNNNAGGIKVDLPQTRQIWIRWYMRWQQGFAWQYINYTKDLYFNAGSTSGSFTAAFHGTDEWGTEIVQPNSQNLFGSKGWLSTMGGLVGDGRWHSYEMHINTSTGLFETWIDGQFTGRSTNANFGGVTIDYVVFGSNQCCVVVQPDMYTDFDDIAVSTTGYIGPIGGSSSTGGPSAPTNLRVTS